MEKFVDFIVCPIIVAGVLGLCWSAIWRPTVFFIVAKPIALTAALAFGSGLYFNWAKYGTELTVKKVVDTATAEKINAAIDNTMIDAWQIVAAGGLAVLLVVFARISKKVLRAERDQRRAEQHPEKH